MTALLPFLAQEVPKLDWAKMPDLGRLAPEGFLCAWLVVILVADLVRGRGASPLYPVLSMIGCAVAAVLVFASSTTGGATGYAGFESLDPDSVSRLFKLVFLGTGLATVFMVRRSRDAYGNEAELHVLLMGGLAGMCYLASATELVGFYLAFETVSYAGFLMAGYRVDNPRSAEAGTKFVLFGAVASAVMLFGLSLIYGYTGSTEFSVIAEKLSAAEGQPLLWVAATFVFAGFAFKAAAFPMQFWCPDVYEGSPAPIASFLAIASKAAVFSAIVRVLSLGGNGPGSPGLTHLLADNATVVQAIVVIASALTMTWGNFAALRQTNMQRMLAYSSIAHAGYLLMTAAMIVPGSPSRNDAIAAILVYFVLYLVMNLAAFHLVTWMRRDAGTADFTALRGLASKQPLVAASILVVMLSLTGLPPTAGFVAKLQLFSPVVKQGFYVLAAIGLLNGAVSLFYYWKPVRAMYVEKPAEGETSRLRAEMPDVAFVAALAVPLVLLGLFGWNHLTQAALDAVSGRSM